ncbi:MAG TPA: DNA polymerase II large subunit [Methanothrix sp.]|nr:DNA polymerase II large subunit [Methanothrix sp.]
MKTADYFELLESGLAEAMEIAGEARKQGKDPSLSVEVPTAVDLAERVEKLIGIDGIAKRARELEAGGMSREEAALAIGLDFAEGRIGNFSTKIEAIDSAIRTSVALLTEGVVAAPIEGIAKVDLGKNDDGTEYLKVYYAGPIRSAGGTAQALSVLVADYVRRGVGIARYKPRPEEVERYVEEIGLYRRVAGLQYVPSDQEIRTLVRNCPICIEGEPTEEEEVSGYRDLERIETNRIRGGVALVSAEGIALKRPKLKKHVSKLAIEGWDWLDELASGGKKDGGASSEKFLRDIIAGRPVFSHPHRPGGFRLRYGRSRNTGLAAAGFSPATMVILKDFLAAGTQVKVEQPGKAAAVSPVSSIEGPTVRLLGGDLVRIDSQEEAERRKNDVVKIVDVGEILISFGDFLENNRTLAPASYSFEWWAAELAEAGGDPAGLEAVGAEEAIEISRRWNVPLHPRFTYLWHDLSVEKYRDLRETVSSEGVLEGGFLLLPLSAMESLETLLVLHRVRDQRIEVDDPLTLLLSLGIEPEGLKQKELEDEPVRGAKDEGATGTGIEAEGDPALKVSASEPKSALDLVNRVAGIKVMARAPTRVGSRMGRPEKSDKREMRPPPHVLFPTGEAGGKSRSVGECAKNHVGNGRPGIIETSIGKRVCPHCGAETHEFLCECGGHTLPQRLCPTCHLPGKEKCPKCGKATTAAAAMKLDVKELYSRALTQLNEREPDLVRGVLGLTSRDKTPESLEKGILRAKHGVFIFKDGTVRYDLTDLPLTHFRPREIHTDVNRLRDLGYTEDIYGEPLTSPDQILELLVQDVILSFDGGEYLLKVAKFVDEELEKFYGLESFYNAATPQDLIGSLLVGLAPHTSAGVLCRLIGYTTASAGYGHPFFHAAKRRNCDGDEDCVMLLLDSLLNFSMSYLPEKRGGKMDAPLVMTTRLDPKEVDGEAHNLDLPSRYPLEFYRATLSGASPKEVEGLIDVVSKRLGTEAQYCGFKFTHDTDDIASGPKNSAYKTLETMIDKMDAQLSLARSIRAVDERDVATRVINSHFLPDLIGNLRAFSRQKVRCVKCGAKFRRPPLSDVCPKCGGRVILTVHEGSVRKYLEVSMKVAEEFGVDDYTKQRLEIIKMDIDSLFQNEKSKQMGLADFM